MKNIGWCLDNIQIVLSRLPKNINSKENKDKAIEIIDEVEKYTKTLEQLVENPKLSDYLSKLDKAPVSGVRLESHEVEALLKDLGHIVYTLNLYIPELRVMIKKHSTTWWYKGKQTIIALTDLLNKNKKKLGKEYTLWQNIKSKIRMRLNQFNNKADRITHEIDERFGGGRGDLRAEFYILLHKEKELKELITDVEHLEKLINLK
jgi:hypothetical protein